MVLGYGSSDMYDDGKIWLDPMLFFFAYRARKCMDYGKFWLPLGSMIDTQS